MINNLIAPESVEPNMVKNPSAQTDEKGIHDIFSSVLNDYSIDFEFNENDLKNIPKNSPFIIVSNHPIKGIDSILMLKVISEARPDLKIINDVVLPKYYSVYRYFIIHNSKEFFRLLNSPTRQESIEYLREGKPIGIFPAGNGNPISLGANIKADPTWSTETIRFIKSAKVPIVPAFFMVKSSFSASFLKSNYWLLPPSLQNESEKKNRKITLRIGSPISLDDQNEFHNIDKFGRFLRTKVYCLRSPIEVTKFYLPGLRRQTKEEPIVAAINPEIISVEVAQLKTDYLLFNNQNYSVICAPADKMPNLITEIGRQRELTFREVGEGTNRSIDIDEFDLYYNQLFIWDNTLNKLVGAYRVGKGRDIIEQYGIKGFYIQSLFRIDPRATSLLEQSLELGRSFIVKEYQRQPLSLFLLWKGILYFLLKNPEYRYLVGPVSISNQYSKLSKTLIIKFVTENFFHKELSSLFKPRNGFKPKISNDIDILLENTKSNLNRLDNIIADIELDHYKVPVLLKKYLKLNAKIMGFNIDPKFNDALDGLIILDLMDVPYNVIQTLSKEINDETILKRFSNIN